MNKPRILLLGKLPPPYIGPAIATEVLLSSSLSEDFEMIHFNTTLNESVGEMGKFGWSKLIRSVASARSLFQLAKQKKGDLALVPINQTTVGFIKDSLYILALRMAGVPVLVQLRGSNFKTWYRQCSGVVKSWVRFCLKRTVGVVVLGEKLRHVFEDFYPPQQIFVAPNGADFPYLNGSRLPTNGKLKILYLSNFLPGKGFDLVLEALASDPAFTEKTELTAYGAWDDLVFRQKCEDIMARHELKNVSIQPPVSGAQKWKALNEAELFVFVPRHPEGHPWAIVEAMAAELPVISTDRGAITESVIHDDNGFIVATENHLELAEKISYFCRQPEMCVSFGKSSRKKYEQQFTAGAMANRYRTIFKQVLKKCVE